MDFCLLYHLLFLLPAINAKIILYKIKPDDPGGPFYVEDQSINDTFIFELEKYDTGHKYQVILSYPGFLPIFCNATITFIEKDHSKHSHNHNHGHRRHLLDTSTDKFSAPILITTE
eukprot:361273_1